VLITKRQLRQLVMLPLLARFHSVKAVCLHNGVNSPSKYQAQWKDDLSMSICLGFSFLYTYNIIYEQLINILLILFNFRFTNIEAAQTITSAFKLLMEIPLFQWSQVSRHPEWRPNIDA